MPPVNDSCATALPFPTSLPFTVTLDTTQATDDPGTPDPNWGSGNSYNGVWYTWQAPAGLTRLGVTMTDANEEGCLSMFTGSCGALVTPDSEPGGFATPGGYTVFNEDLVPGQRYYVLITSYDPGGCATLEITFFHPEPQGDFCTTIAAPPPPGGTCTVGLLP